jgi:hypothetical protein
VDAMPDHPMSAKQKEGEGELFVDRADNVSHPAMRLHVPSG